MNSLDEKDKDNCENIIDSLNNQISNLEMIIKDQQTKLGNSISIDNSLRLNILIIGGGPVSLTIGYKLMKSCHRVTIIERYIEPIRKQIISIYDSLDFDILSFLPKAVINELLEKGGYYGSFANQRFNDKCFKSFLQNKYDEVFQPRILGCIIKEYEMILSKYFKSLGGILIRPSKEKKLDIKEFTQKKLIIGNLEGEHYEIDFDLYDLIIGADGCNGQSRDIFFRDDQTLNHRRNILFYGKPNDPINDSKLNKR